MRFHHTVLSHLNLNKFLNISYEPKSKYLLEDFDFSSSEIYFGVNNRQFFKIEKDINNAELIDTFKKVYNNRFFQSKSYKLKLKH
jgi:polysaccharide pyruvyl transferase WcaK-like protein